MIIFIQFTKKKKSSNWLTILFVSAIFIPPLRMENIDCCESWKIQCRKCEGLYWYYHFHLLQPKPCLAKKQNKTKQSRTKQKKKLTLMFFIHYGSNSKQTIFIYAISANHQRTSAWVTQTLRVTVVFMLAALLCCKRFIPKSLYLRKRNINNCG